MAAQPKPPPAHIDQLKQLLEKDLETDTTLGQLASTLNANPYTLLRQFKTITGLTPHAFRLNCRIEKAKNLLRKGENLAQVALDWLHWAGAAYLIYLGIRQWRAAHLPIEIDTRKHSAGNLFSQGMVVTVFNPKSLVFIAAFLPQFMDAGRPAGIQLALIIPTFLAITFCVTSVWALAAGNARALFRGRPAFQFFLKTAGGMTVLAGIGLVFARRH